MNKSEIILAINKRVEKLLTGERTGHDYWHINRVRNTALTIAKQEKADLFVTELAALLHDIGDHKFHNGDHTVGPRMTAEWLNDYPIENEIKETVIDVVKQISYKGADVATPMSSLEGKCVQDADRLDAIGAIGIARCFAYGGNKNREIYNPNQKPTMHKSFDDYKNDKGHTINHFYEKLLLLKDRMNTNYGKQMAEKRHKVMEEFLDQFYNEWDGKC